MYTIATAQIVVGTVYTPDNLLDCSVARYQKELWDLIEHPDTSTAAHIVSYISMMFVVVSTIGMSLNTMPGLKVNYIYLMYCEKIFNIFKSANSALHTMSQT